MFSLAIACATSALANFSESIANITLGRKEDVESSIQELPPIKTTDPFLKSVPTLTYRKMIYSQ